MGQLERVERMTKQKVKRVTGDAGYAHAANYAALEERLTEAVIPPQEESRKCKHIPLRRFKYDGKHDVMKCPVGRKLCRGGYDERGRRYRARRKDCQACPLRQRCLPDTAKARQVLIVDGYEALLRARRWRSRWDQETCEWYERHRWRVEGRHGEAKTQHGLRRAARRGLWNMEIQSYLTAAVQNLKRLAALLSAFLGWMERHRGRGRDRGGIGTPRTERMDLYRSDRRAA